MATEHGDLMAEHDDLDRQLVAALTPQPVQLEDSGEGQVEERKSHGPVSPPSADSEKSCSRYPDDIFGTHRRPELEKRCPNGLRRARGVAGGDDEVGLGLFGCSADPIQPSGSLEPSIPCLSTVLRLGFVDANP